MNKQYKNPTQRGIEWTDYTFNPIGGCKHACRWTMPDGSIAKCYAEEVAEGVAQSAYPHGFQHHYWKPDTLTAPANLKKPAKIFIDSMSDLMGHWVPDEQVQAVLDACAAAPWHTFQLLTKNAPRLLKFKFPANVWVGVSAPPTEFMGKPITIEQRQRYVSRALDVLAQIRPNNITWMSIEPLSFDIAEEAFWPWLDNNHHANIPLDWAVIGAATNGRKVYQPESGWVYALLSEYLTSTPVFFKGNLRGNPAATPWREEFPTPKQSPLI